MQEVDADMSMADASQPLSSTCRGRVFLNLVDARKAADLMLRTSPPLAALIMPWQLDYPGVYYSQNTPSAATAMALYARRYFRRVAGVKPAVLLNPS